ncbi:hypothetical protein CPT_Mater142 [Bacillus phage Mater]|uniref:Uncharacterized protein n=1 Tax=Bacillus phage Mater TaxID=1540090 RepID=A0A0A0RNT2_9CAUD|nr:hypothetical protein CPT_Mater142 [Bacillus phage Mater]AIW03299.1 hypothetical protein CPT_Mater142 [Bacillus phage Mater]
MITINIKVRDDAMLFVTDYELPDGSIFIQDEGDPENFTYAHLIPHEGATALINYSTGRQRKVRIHDVNPDDFRVTDI